MINSYKTIPTFVFLFVVIHISDFWVVPRRIPRGTRLAQRVVHAANTIAFPLEHERYIACVLHAAPLSANTYVVSVPEVGELSRVYASDQSNVTVNCACAAFSEFRRWFAFVCCETKKRPVEYWGHVLFRFIGIYLFSTATRFVWLDPSTQIKHTFQLLSVQTGAAGYGQTSKTMRYIFNQSIFN